MTISAIRFDAPFATHGTWRRATLHPGATTAADTNLGRWNLGAGFALMMAGFREAARLGIAPATIVTIASPRPALTPFGPQPRTVNLRVAGLFRSGKSEQQARAALPIDRAELLFGADRPVTTVPVKQGIREYVRKKHTRR